jgi:ribosomal protein S8
MATEEHENITLKDIISNELEDVISNELEDVISDELEDAIRVGDFDLFEKKIKEGKPIDWQIFYFVAENGNVKMAEFLIKNGWKMHKELCYVAASYGQLDFLKWCEERNYLKNIDDCFEIALINLESLIKDERLEESKKFVETISWITKLKQTREINICLQSLKEGKKINKPQNHLKPNKKIYKSQNRLKPNKKIYELRKSLK